MMLHVGYRYFVARDKILAITPVNSAPIKRLRTKAMDNEKLIDCTVGRSTKSLIHLVDGFIVASSNTSETLIERLRYE